MIEAVFIDRDGTIGGNDKIEYPGDFSLYSYSLRSIQKLKRENINIISFTNQPGIANGKAKKEQFENELYSFGFDHVYLCPHRQGDDCHCRKPNIGMLEQAAREKGINLSNCVVIGDRWTDMVAAHRAGCIAILVKTGAGKEALRKYYNHEYDSLWNEAEPNFIADNLEKAVEWLLLKQL
ncbi:HAD-IIIA family hydrolase [Evansella halocellulosilytica]|uniref:HAD-IIIA family hydrolase n=1 Tax=Evansella halocellulosilytica TaxID=2011013 RepID=UPI000BB8EA6C|nr:HAD-IIIA family hydrolase [Evansella halocellulosilytica]